MRNKASSPLRKLDDSQVEAFDTDYVSGARWSTVKNLIEQDFPDGRFNFIDVGGGNGRFADRLLEQYPEATGLLIDSSEVLLTRNAPNSRKTLKCCSVEDLSRLDTKFDLICVHWLLHHLVSNSYRQTRQNQLDTLNRVGKLLTSRGRISIFENLYDGWLIKSLPGRLIYHLTSTKAFANIARRMGANTAGVGVCFLSKEEWFLSFKNAGLQVLSYVEPDSWTWWSNIEWRMFLHVGQRKVGHFWCSPLHTASEPGIAE